MHRGSQALTLSLSSMLATMFKIYKYGNRGSKTLDNLPRLRHTESTVQLGHKVKSLGSRCRLSSVLQIIFKRHDAYRSFTDTRGLCGDLTGHSTHELLWLKCLQCAWRMRCGGGGSQTEEGSLEEFQLQHDLLGDRKDTDVCANARICREQPGEMLGITGPVACHRTLSATNSFS